MENLLTWRERGHLWLRLGIRLALAVLAVLAVRYLVVPGFALLMPFVLALVMAWMLSPLIRGLQKRLKISRSILSLVLLLLVFGVLGGMLCAFFYTLLREIQSLANNWQSLWTTFQVVLAEVSQWVEGIIEPLPNDVGAQLLLLGDKFMVWLQAVVPTLLGNLASGAGSVAMSIPTGAVAAVIFAMACYFISADYPHLRFVTASHIPAEFRGFLSKVKDTAIGAFGGYVKAQVILSFFIFLILLFGFFIIRQEYALLIAFLLAIMDFIPIIGSGTIMVPWAVVDLVTGNYRHAVSLLVVWGVIALFRRLAEPKVVGDQTGLSPILSLLSIYVGMQLGGVGGMVIGPMVALIVVNIIKGGVLTGTGNDLRLALTDVNGLLRNGRPPAQPPEEDTP